MARLTISHASALFNARCPISPDIMTPFELSLGNQKQVGISKSVADGCGGERVG